MRIRQSVLASLAALACACAAAQTQGITLQEAQRAAASNLDVSLARHALASARADVSAADHAPAPVLSAKASSMDLQHGLGPGNVLRDKRIDKSVGVDWTWERGGKRELRTRAAQLGAQAASADLQDAVLQQQLAVSAAWYELLAAQEKVLQVEAIQASAEQLRDTAQRRLKAGDLSRQEAARVDIEAERARADLQAAISDRAKAAITLSQSTGADVRAAAGGWPNPAPGASTNADVEQRADVRAARQRVLAAEAALDGALAMRRSDVTVGASIDHFPGTSTRQLELRLQVPITGGFAYGFEGEIARARAQLGQAEDQLAKTRRLAATEMQRLAQELGAAAQRAAAYRDTVVPRAREVASMAEFAYSRGALSLADLIDARRTLRAVLLEDIAARADHGRALAAWQLRTSEPLAQLD